MTLADTPQQPAAPEPDEQPTRAEQVAAIPDPRVLSGLDAPSREQWWAEWDLLLEQQAAALSAFQALLVSFPLESAVVLAALVHLRRATAAVRAHWALRHDRPS